MAANEHISELLQLMDECTSTDIDDLVTNRKWGIIDFADCKEDLERVFSVLRPLKEMPLESLEETIIRKVKAHLLVLKENLEAIKNFTVEQPDPPAARTQLSNNLKDAVINVWSSVAPWLGYLAFQAGDVQENLRNISSLRSEAESILADVKKFAEDGKNEIKDAIVAAKDAAGEAGVAHYTEDFGGEARNFGIAAGKWLMATGVLADSTVVAAFLLWYLFAAPYFVDVPELIQLTTMKLVILGLLFTATLWCGRMYKAAKHQEAVNRHRANALKTFQAFIEAAGDPTTRDAVLMETTRSIFAITPSGYLGERDSSADSGSKIIEITKALRQVTTKDGN